MLRGWGPFRRLGIVVGFLVGVGFCEYHNDHVSWWYGGHIFTLQGFLVVGAVLAVAGGIIGEIFDRDRARSHRDGER